jgi:sialidase-1
MTINVKDGGVPIDIQTGQIAAGNVPVGTVQQTVPITIAESAAPGTYRIPIEYEYQETFQIRHDASGITESREFTRTETGSITVEVKEDARFAVVETNGTAQVGDDSDVAVTLRNTGTQPARNANVIAESRSASLTFDSGATSSTANVGDWEPGEVRTVTYQVALASDAAVRGYTLDLSVDYDDTNGIGQTSEPITTGIEALPEQSFAFSNVSSSLRVGEEGSIVGTVENTGPQPVESVVVRYADTSETVIPIEESTAVGSLAAGESASFELPIAVSSEARAGTNSIDFAVRYRTADRERQTYDKLDVQANVAPKREQFDVALTNHTIETGGAQTLSVSVTNNLNETVTDVEARLFADDPLSTGETDTGYVESLEPGETVTVTFELTAAASATPGKTYPISFDFRYDDAQANSQLSNTVRVPIDVTEAEEGGLPVPLILVVVIIMAIAGAVWYRRQ